jgi:hypothetical protein
MAAQASISAIQAEVDNLVASPNNIAFETARLIVPPGVV